MSNSEKVRFSTVVALIKIMNRIILIAFSAALLSCVAMAADPLAQGFANPPEQTKPWCYWYWISDNISKEGITKDLEAMRRAGIGEALIGNIFLTPEYGADVPPGKVKVLSPEWWEMVEHAVREGGRVGVNIGLFNCPGWSQSGGPWIKPEETMRYLTSSEMRVTGPLKFEQKLPAPRALFQDVAVLAFPAPQNDADTLAAKKPRVTCTPAVADAVKVVDERLDTALVFPEGAGQGGVPFTVEVKLDASLTARSLQIFPAEKPFSADVELQAADASGAFQTVRRFKCDWSNLSTAVGFIPQAPVAISFPATTALCFRLVFTNVVFGHRNFIAAQGAALAEINLSGAARLESFVEKQLGKMHSTPLPMWDTYLWPTPAEPDSAKLVVPAGDVRDLSKNLAADGTLRWDVPAGEWIIQRTGMTPTGMSNSPASPQGRGYEVDKMNRKLAQQHFDAFIGELLRRMPAKDRKALKHVIADSYEMGAQNWTDGFGEQFQKRYGYDPKPWLPVITGRIIGSADQSERFLWDLRRLVADRVATDYVGGLREASKARGVGLWLENYGHWGFPGEFLKYGSESDRIGGEFWVAGDLGSIECRAASSCANTYGRKFVSAESFTGGPPFQNAPANLKARGDWSFCEGINHVVLHVFIHQPWEDKWPGVNAPWGTEFNRHNTWFEQGRTWIEYLRRSSWLLQQGNRVADVAYFIGDDAPKMTGERKPELPAGRDFDYINGDVIEKSLSVKNGVLTLPHGTTYRLLVLPELSTMRPEVLRKIHSLVKAGATVFGTPPLRSPSLENFPKCDDEVRKLAGELWGEADVRSAGEHSFGQGRVVWGKSLDDVLGKLGSQPDFESSTRLRFTHRRSDDTEIYFVANPGGNPLNATAAFRAGNKAPELWWPDSGRIERPVVYEAKDGIVRLPLTLGPNGSVFVLFREPAAPLSQQVVSVTHNGDTMLAMNGVAPSKLGENFSATNTFTLAAWVKPAADTGLADEAAQGAAGASLARNEIVPATHGLAFGDQLRHAGAGLTVGRNGVSVFEHAAYHYAPTLVHAANIFDWTHVALVYRDGQPSLYLNGVLAHRGMRSGFIVHPGLVPEKGAASFVGQLSGFTQVNRALAESELTQLMRTTPRPRDELPGGGLELQRDAGGGVSGWAWETGSYRLQLATGRTLAMNASAVPAPLVFSGPWEVDFTPGWGAPEKVVFDSLTDWTKHAEEGIRHYSGKATYRKNFDLTGSPLEIKNSKWLLDLGEVRDLATVRVNGKELATLWLAPWQLDVTGVVKPGRNTLEVEIVNVWNNRLAGDASLPENQRRTFIIVPTVNKDTPLLPAGLLGPVTLHSALKVAVKQ
jgi:hypothetical protein